MDRKAFYDLIRPHVNLTTQNVSGMDKVLDYGAARRTPLNRFAYVIATAWWESAQTMWPVKEAYWLSEDWRRRNLRYYPWYGRGLIQTTWEENYRKMGNAVGVNLIGNPDKLLEWSVALPALFIGMEQGLYTGKALNDYIDLVDESDAEDLREFANARRIVNGTDKQVTIGKLALHFEHALRGAGYDPNRQPDDPGLPEPEPTPRPEPPPPMPSQKPEQPSAPPSFWAALAALFFSFFRKG